MNGSRGQSLLWAILLVATDVTALVVFGLLALRGVFSPELAASLITGIVAGNRVPAAVQLFRGRDEDEPPSSAMPSGDGPRSRGGPRAVVVTGAVLAILFGAGSWLTATRRTTT